MHITENRVQIPARFRVQLYKSDGSPQDGTIDVKVILEYEEMQSIGIEY